MSAYNYGFNNPITWQDANGTEPGDDPKQRIPAIHTGSAADNARSVNVVEVKTIPSPQRRAYLESHGGYAPQAPADKNTSVSATRDEHRTEGQQAAHDDRVKAMLHDAGYKSDGTTQTPLKKLGENKTFNAAAENVVLPTLDLAAAVQGGRLVIGAVKAIARGAALETAAVATAEQAPVKATEAAEFYDVTGKPLTSGKLPDAHIAVDKFDINKMPKF